VFSKVQWRFSSGEEVATVGDEEAEVAGAGLVDAGEIDLVQNGRG